LNWHQPFPFTELKATYSQSHSLSQNCKQMLTSGLTWTVRPKKSPAVQPSINNVLKCAVILSSYLCLGLPPLKHNTWQVKFQYLTNGVLLTIEISPVSCQFFLNFKYFHQLWNCIMT
jgi:hypothetical protein